MRSRLLAALAVTVAVATTTAATDADARAPRRNGKTRLAQAGGASKSPNVQTLVLKAREMFDDQRYEESIQTLSGALVRPGSKPAERIEIYKLLAFNYITLGKNDEADSAARAIFVLDEGFALPKTESPRFREFFEKSKKTWEDEGKPGVEAGGGPAVVTEKPISIKHAPPAAQVAPGTVIKLEGTVDDPDVRVTKVELYFRSGAKGKFTQKTLAFAMGSFRGEIPAASVVPPLVEYYVQAVDKGGLPVGLRGDSEAPLRIAVPEDSSLMWYEHPGFWVPVGLAVTAGVVLGAVFGTMGGSETPRSTVRVTVTE
jgi:hypothetical protein